MRSKATQRVVLVCAAAALGGGLVSTGCGAWRDKVAQKEGKTMDAQAALAALKKAEATGKLDGLEIEHYIGGGMPPPYYRSEQFRLYGDAGRDTLAFVTPDYTANVGQGEAYPRSAYRIASTPAEVTTIARLVRESGAFDMAPPSDAGPADAFRTEVVVMLGGKEVKRVYPGAAPPELAKLREAINKVIEHIKANGVHRIDP